MAGVSAHPAWSGRSLDEEERGCLGISGFRAQCGLDPIKVGDVILLEVVFEGELGPRNLVEFKSKEDVLFEVLGDFTIRCP